MIVGGERASKMKYGVHLPVIAFDGQPWSLRRLVEYTVTAERLGFEALSVNDHMLFARPWLDGLTAMASILPHTGQMTLSTTVALPVVRGPVPLAKGLAAIDVLSGGRLVVCVGAGSSAPDYLAVGVPFEERWKRLEEAVQALRALWRRDAAPFAGKFYNTESITLEPYPSQPLGPPIWIGSWGSAAGLRRTARLGDGWLASAYNTTPQGFADSRRELGTYLLAAGKDPTQFPNAIASMFFHVSDDRAATERLVRTILAPALNRPEHELRQRLLLGSAEGCAEQLAAYAAAGAQGVFAWPVDDELRQLAMFMERVIPLV